MAPDTAIESPRPLLASRNFGRQIFLDSDTAKNCKTSQPCKSLVSSGRVLSLTITDEGYSVVASASHVRPGLCVRPQEVWTSHFDTSKPHAPSKYGHERISVILFRPLYTLTFPSFVLPFQTRSPTSLMSFFDQILRTLATADRYTLRDFLMDIFRLTGRSEHHGMIPGVFPQGNTTFGVGELRSLSQNVGHPKTLCKDRVPKYGR